jgi:DNA-binding transcriptional MocR family regulator
MGNIFSDRISDVPRSFIREILKLAVDESVISFAGGLPNRDLFPVEEIKREQTNSLTKRAKISCSTAHQKAISNCGNGSPTGTGQSI